MNNVEWGWRGQTPPAGGEPDPGRGNFLSPRSCGQSSERLISWYLSRSRFCLPAHRHLGTRSPSGNTRGGCRGCTPKLSIITEVKICHQPETMFYILLCILFAVSSLKKPELIPIAHPKFKNLPAKLK